MTTSLADEATTLPTATDDDAAPAAAEAPPADAPTMPHPFVLEPNAATAAEGVVIGSLPCEIEVNVAVAGMPPMTLGTVSGRLGRILATSAPEDGGAYRDVTVHGPTMAEMARTVARLLEAEVVPGLRELADEAEASEASEASDAEARAATEAAHTGETRNPLALAFSHGGGCCQGPDRAAAEADGATVKCPGPSGPIAGGTNATPVSDTPDSSDPQ